MLSGNLIINEDSSLLDEYIKTNFYKVTGNFELASDSITSLQGCPKEVTENCSIRTKTGTKISSFQGCPEKVGKVFKYFDIYNEFSSIEGICRSAHTYRMYVDGVYSYHNVHKYVDSFYLFEMTPHVKECLLGFVLVKNAGSLIKGYNNKILDSVVDIINKHLPNKDVLECQEELIEKGYKEYAKL